MYDRELIGRNNLEEMLLELFRDRIEKFRTGQGNMLKYIEKHLKEGI